MAKGKRKNQKVSNLTWAYHTSKQPFEAPEEVTAQTSQAPVPNERRARRFKGRKGHKQPSTASRPPCNPPETTTNHPTTVQAPTPEPEPTDLSGPSVRQRDRKPKRSATKSAVRFVMEFPSDEPTFSVSFGSVDKSLFERSSGKEMKESHLLFEIPGDKPDFSVHFGQVDESLFQLSINDAEESKENQVTENDQVCVDAPATQAPRPEPEPEEQPQTQTKKSRRRNRSRKKKLQAQSQTTPEVTNEPDHDVPDEPVQVVTMTEPQVHVQAPPAPEELTQEPEPDEKPPKKKNRNRKKNQTIRLQRHLIQLKSQRASPRVGLDRSSDLFWTNVPDDLTDDDESDGEIYYSQLTSGTKKY